jgi:hypothetical protein
VNTQPLVGGCLCGAIRYEIDRVFDVIYCHCNQCRRSSGGPVLLSAAVAGNAFRVTSGTPAVYPTSAAGRNHFCANCGTSLFGEYRDEGHLLARDGRYYSVRVGTLDDAERVRPQIHQFVENNSPGSTPPMIYHASRATLFHIPTSGNRFMVRAGYFYSPGRRQPGKTPSRNCFRRREIAAPLWMSMFCGGWCSGHT